MITFEEKNHTYKNDGVAIPSVSEILGAVLGSHYEDIPEIAEKCEKISKVKSSIRIKLK